LLTRSSHAVPRPGIDVPGGWKFRRAVDEIADAALYRAKPKGQNCVETSPSVVA
jgi:hypothetical protein